MQKATAIALSSSIGLTSLYSALLTALLFIISHYFRLLPTHFISPVSLWLTLTLVLLTWKAASRLFLSPLSHIPGPKIAAFTQIYEFYFDVILGGQYTWEIRGLHEKYGQYIEQLADLNLCFEKRADPLMGPIIRISPHELHISDPDFAEKLYGHGKVRDRWGWALGMFGIEMNVGMLTTVEHELHRKRRGALNSLFSRKAIASYDGRIKGFVEKMCKRLKEEEGLVIRLDLVYAACTLDIVSDFCFGEAYGALEREDLYRDVTVGMLEASQALHFNKFFPWVVKGLKALPEGIMKWLNPGIEELLVLQKRWASDSERILNGSDPDSRRVGAFLAMLKSPVFPPSDRNVSHLIASAQNIIGPGTTTTAAFLTRTTFHMLNNPKVLSKLNAELKAVIPDPNLIPPVSELEQLPYLTAVIHEGHRISHGLSHRLQRIAREDLIYKSWKIPAGTPVGMTPSIMAMNEDVFPDRKIFDPDRYLGNQEDLRRKKAAFNPFGKGPRSCLGINLATAEAYMILATVFRRFEFELFETETEDVDVARDYFAALPQVGARWSRVLVKLRE